MLSMQRCMLDGALLACTCNVVYMTTGAGRIKGAHAEHTAWESEIHTSEMVLLTVFLVMWQEHAATTF